MNNTSINRDLRTKIIKAVSYTYLYFNKEATSTEIAHFINKHGLTFTRTEISSYEVGKRLDPAEKDRKKLFVQ